MREGLLRAVASAAGLMLMLMPVPTTWAQERDTVRLAVKGDRLTLRARDVPVTVVLERLAKAAGFAVHFEEEIEERVSADFANVKLDEGIRRLLKHWNTLVLYDENRGMPSAVHVFGPRGSTTETAMSAGPDATTGSADAWTDGEVDFDAYAFKKRLRVEAVEQDLRAASSLGSPAGMAQNRLADPDASVRATALQWLAGRRETAVDALVAGLTDRDDLVQTVATEALFDRGLGEEAVEEIKSAAQAADPATVRRMLGALYAR